MLWALQSVKPAKALRCASFVYYYVLRYHMFCALMATFLCWSFGKSTVFLRLVCLSSFPPTSPPLFFFFLNPAEEFWELGRFDLAGNAWVFLHAGHLISVCSAGQPILPVPDGEGLKDIHMPWLICPAAMVRQLSWPLTRLWRGQVKTDLLKSVNRWGESTFCWFLNRNGTLYWSVLMLMLW